MITRDSPTGSDSQHRLSDLVSANTIHGFHRHHRRSDDIRTRRALDQKPCLRDAIPKAHALATAEFNTIRLRLLKLGARVVEMASRVRLAFAAACPDATLIRHIAAALMPAGP